MGLLHWLNNTYGEKPLHIPNGAPAPLVRRRFRFSGLVQGVGFRYEVQRIASQLDLVGWVQNQRDGSVVIEIEGKESCIGAFLLAIKAVRRFDITEIQTEDLQLAQTEKSFRLLY